MQYNHTLKTLKSVIRDMLDSRGNFRVQPIGGIGSMNFPEERLKFIRSLIVFLLKTDFFNYETRAYILDYGVSLSRLFEELQYNPEYEKADASKQVMVNRIYRDASKFTSTFGASMLSDVCYSNEDFSHYRETLASQFVAVAGNDMRYAVRLKLDRKVVSTHCDEEEYKEFISAILPYIDSQMSFIENNISKTAVGYFNYLLSVPDKLLEGEDLERKKKLREILSPKED